MLNQRLHQTGQDTCVDFNRLAGCFLIFFIMLGLMSKFVLLFQRPVNHDEFFYLSRIYDYMRNRLNTPFQNFHVYFFTWLSLVDKNEMLQVIAGRMVMYLFFSGSCAYIFLIGKYYCSKTGALFSVLCYISFIYTVANGAGFRSDTIPVFLFLFSLHKFLLKPRSIVLHLISGLFMAIAILFTIKSAIYVTIFITLFLIKLIFYRKSIHSLLPMIVFFLSLISGFALIYKSQYAYALSAAPSAATTLPIVKGLTKSAGNAYSFFVVFNTIFPQFEFFKLSLRIDWVIWLFLVTGIIINAVYFTKNRQSFKNLSLFIIIIPLFSLLFYRNAFPYFYPFITPTATIFCGYTLWKLTENNLKIRSKVSFMMTIICCILIFSNNLIFINKTFSLDQNKSRYQTLNIIHEMFPEPVTYIDGSGMVSSFPKTGFFMSDAGMKGYLKRKPIMRDLLNNKKPLFVLANASHLDLNSKTPPLSYTGLALHQEDWDVLKSNYVHHWGSRIWVIGKQFEFTSDFKEDKFNIIIPGNYTLHGNRHILIDNNPVNTANCIYLSKGFHSIENQGSPGRIVLKWGNHLYQPTEKPITKNIY